MWQVIATLFASFTSSLTSPTTPISNNSIFSKEQIIFSSNFNITKILVQAEGNRFVNEEFSNLPSIFFTVTDSKLDGGSCIYVLEDLAAYEILEGGRDSTADYSTDQTVYFGAKDGVYKYDPDSFSAKKLGPFRDSVIQIQKANGTDKIYILRDDGKLLVLEANGTVRTKVQNVVCATEFVLDTSNNIYFVQCGDKTIHILKAHGANSRSIAILTDEFDEIKLIRPAFIMEESIPFLGNGNLYILHVNGTNEKKDINIEEKPSAFSVDAALYFVAALDGKIHEFNVMEVMLQSMFGIGPASPKGVTSIITSLLENAKDGIFGFYKVMYPTK